MTSVSPGLSSGYAPWRISRSGLSLVAAAHGLVLLALLQVQSSSPPQAPASAAAVLSVSLLPMVETRTPQPSPPVITPQRPQPVVRQPMPLSEPPRLAMPSDAPAPASAVPAVARQEATPLQVQPASASTIAPAPASAAAPSPPRFDADYLDNPKPPYPAISRRLGEQGRVVLRVRVDAAGLAVDVQLHASSGSVRLDSAALETVRRWKFVPARLGGENPAAIAATVLVPIAFSLKD